MKISSYNSTSFTSIPLYDVKLRKKNYDGTYKEIDAKFSKLDREDSEDRDIMQNLFYDWQSSDFGGNICMNFLFPNVEDENADFYVVEGKDKEGKRKIYSASEVHNHTGKIDFIQAEPNNKKEKIKGSGELMLYGIAKEIKDEGENCFSLSSTDVSENFYRHLKLTEDNSKPKKEGEGPIFHLKTSNKENFLKGIEEKYNLDVQA